MMWFNILKLEPGESEELYGPYKERRFRGIGAGTPEQPHLEGREYHWTKPEGIVPFIPKKDYVETAPEGMNALGWYKWHPSTKKGIIYINLATVGDYAKKTIRRLEQPTHPDATPEQLAYIERRKKEVDYKPFDTKDPELVEIWQAQAVYQFIETLSHEQFHAATKPYMDKEMERIVDEIMNNNLQFSEKQKRKIGPKIAQIRKQLLNSFNLITGTIWQELTQMVVREGKDIYTAMERVVTEYEPQLKAELKEQVFFIKDWQKKRETPPYGTNKPDMYENISRAALHHIKLNIINMQDRLNQHLKDRMEQFNWDVMAVGKSDWKEQLKKYDWGKRPSQQTSFEERLEGWTDKFTDFWKKLLGGLALHKYTPEKIRQWATVNAIYLPKFYNWIDQKQMDATGKKLKKLIRQAMEEKE